MVWIHPQCILHQQKSKIPCNPPSLEPEYRWYQSVGSFSLNDARAAITFWSPLLHISSISEYEVVPVDVFIHSQNSTWQQKKLWNSVHQLQIIGDLRLNLLFIFGLTAIFNSKTIRRRIHTSPANCWEGVRNFLNLSSHTLSLTASARWRQSTGLIDKRIQQWAPMFSCTTYRRMLINSTKKLLKPWN